ncbi:MAG TPA: 3'-5' exonuclease [Burkholderiales bacterium]|nr:3'-5' exonuclease [Burkholderiales bacterium]
MILRLRRWLGLERAGDELPLRAPRWVVVDCESGGLDPRRDPLLSVGAVAVREGRIQHAESFGAVLRQARASDAANILIHGIGAEAQMLGRDPGAVLRDFVHFAGEGPLVAFHAAFDRALLARAIPGWQPRWLDLAQLAPALFPARAAACRSLDEWLAAFSIGHPARHDALADAYATAQLLLVLLAEAERQRLGRVRDLFATERGRRWLG